MGLVLFGSQNRGHAHLTDQLLSVWQILTGPNDDWPLALCDFRSIDLGKDAIPTDRLHEDHIGENELLFPNTKHKWYYLPGQLTDQLLVFQNADASGLRPSTCHAFLPMHDQFRVVPVARD